MDHSSTFWILPLRLRSTTGIWRRQVTDIVVLYIFSFSFFSYNFASFFCVSFFPLFLPLSSTTLNSSPCLHHHHPHSCPSAPDCSPSEARSCCPADSHPCLRPTLSPPLSVHLCQQEPEPMTPQHQDCVVHDPQLVEGTLLVHAEHHESPLQSPIRHQQKHRLQVGAEMTWPLGMKKQLPQRCCHPPWNQ